MIRRALIQRTRTTAALALSLALVGAACTSGGDSDQAAADQAASAQATLDEASSDESAEADQLDSADTEAGAEGERSDDGVPEPADLDGIEQLWIDNGTDPELAQCYRGVLADAGVEGVADLNELTDVMANLDGPSQLAIDDCLG